ncbi:MAG: rhodanese-like domain-containing protein [Candidatus Thioglobus sp.]|nr:rhodanese-like domain-containing protein [Candidatus Thioglobus pontius]MBL6976692.1 rhodanese-like domain-containing protein [Candidatus Thioglobus sp.]MBL6984334.1 rhodanese-like domain-containing protein [Candidatus Thioglobus sp.]
MDGYQQLVQNALATVEEVFPWDLEEEIEADATLILLDIREADEFEMMHIKNSLHVPRGVLEGSCVWNYDDTVPELARARDQNIVVICRSGNRSVLAAQTMQLMGFENVRSLKMGIKGWNDNDIEMIDAQQNIVDIDKADEWLNKAISADKLAPQ